MSLPKLTVPRTAPYVVHRERCLQALTRAVRDHRIVLVVAPAGYGKSTVVADWASQRGGPHRVGHPGRG